MIKITIFITYIIFFCNYCVLSQSMDGYDHVSGFWRIAEQNNNTSAYNAQGHITDNSSVWLPLQTSVTSQITSIIFLDTLSGWAAHTGMGTVRTTNGGSSWETISFNDTSFTTGFNSIHFINHQTGWTVGGSLQIRKTTNGGANWVRQVPPPAAGILRSVYFADANTGYAAGSKNFPYIPFICKTTNGGTTWSEISPTIPGAQELNDQHWFNVSTGWICGYDVLLFTTNGGISFTNHFSNVPPSGNGHISLLSIDFTSEQTGWIGAANLERNNVYKTTNGGANWVFQDNPISQGNMNQINDVKFINENLGWAVHGTPSSGAVMYTTNGGSSWVIEEQSVNWFDCLSAYSDRKAWCGSSGGKIWYTFPDIPVSVSSHTNLPDDFILHQSYPNPFNPVTVISFELPQAEYVSIKIYNALGAEIAVLFSGKLIRGYHSLEWNAEKHNSGIYFYRITAGRFSETKKMVLLK